MSACVGIDVHRKRSQLAVIDARGEVLANRNVPNGAEPILGVIGGLPPGTPTAFEAAFGTGSSWSGCGPCCATGSTPCWPATATAVPPGAGGGPGREWLASLELPAASREVVDDDLALTGALEVPIDRLDCEIRQRARSDPRVKILTQLPGVGPFTALVLLAEIGDITRFASARKLASWAGLTPTVRGSDRVAHYGHISKQGSAHLRWVLCEAAQTAKRSPEFADTFQAIARRRGKKIATTAVARKLLTRAWHLLTDAGLAVPQPAAAPAPETRRR